MTVSIAAGKVQVLVGSDNQDWSEAFTSLSLNDPEVDDSGQLPISGTLTLAVLANPPDSQDPLSSAGRQRWKKGQRIILNYQKSNGQWARHPRGWLYISRSPAPPQIGYPSFLEIGVVCALQLQTFPQPRGKGIEFEPQFSGLPNQTLKPTNSFTRTDAIAQLLPRAGLQSLQWVGQIPKHPLANSVGLTGDSIPELMGQLAYGGIAVLQQNNQGQLTAYSAATTKAAPLLALDESQCVGIEFLEGGEAPCEQVFFNSSLSYTVQLFTNNTDFSENYGDGSAVDPALLGNTITIRQTSTTETVTSDRKVITEDIRAPLGLVSPVAYPKNTSLGTDSLKTTTWNYADNGKLSLKTVEESGLFAKFCATYLGRLSKADRDAFAGIPVTRTTRTTYQYENDVLRTMTTQTDEPIAAIVTDEKLPLPFQIKTSFWQSVTYQNRGEGEWRKTQVTMVPAYKKGSLQLKLKNVGERIAVKSALITDPDGTSTETSNSGQYNPPAAERSPVKTEEKSAPIEGSCTFVVAQTPFSPRERRYSLEVGVTSSAQLTELAQLEGARILGRSQGIRLQIPLLDALVDNPAPLQNFTLTRTELLPTGKRRNIYLYQMDGLGFEHEPDRAVVTFSGIWLGTIEGELVPHTQTPTAPQFNSNQVQAIYESIALANSDSTSTEIVIVPPPVIKLPLLRGLGIGREVRYRSNDFSSRIQLVRGLGIGRAIVQSGRLVRGLGLGREVTVREPRTPLGRIQMVRGLGVGRLLGSNPLRRQLERGLGVGRAGANIWGLQQFTFSGTAPDAAGILNFFGTNFGRQTWINPTTWGLTLAASAVATGSTTNLTDRAVNANNATSNAANSWYRVDFGVGRSVRLTSYYLQHDGTTSNYLRNWQLQGSNDLLTWDTLDSRTNDTTINAANAFGAFTCNSPNTSFYRYLRILQNGVNSSATNTLTLAEWEFYGFFDY